MVSKLEKNLIEQSFKNNIHADFRPLISERNKSFSIAQPDEFTMISDFAQGDTTIFCLLNAKLDSPKGQRYHLGVFRTQIHFNPFKTIEHMANQNINETHSVCSLSKTKQREFTIKQILRKALNKTRLVNLERLCILAGKKIWNISLNIYIKKDNGNIYESAFEAAYLTLYNFCLPAHKITNGVIKLLSKEEKDFFPLIERENLDKKNTFNSDVKLIALYCFIKKSSRQFNNVRSEKSPIERMYIKSNESGEGEEVSSEEGEIKEIKSNCLRIDFVTDPTLQEENLCNSVFVAVLKNDQEVLYSSLFGYEMLDRSEFLEANRMAQKIFVNRKKMESLN